VRHILWIIVDQQRAVRSHLHALDAREVAIVGIAVVSVAFLVGRIRSIGLGSLVSVEVVVWLEARLLVELVRVCSRLVWVLMVVSLGVLRWV